ncbi:hypothetical protein SAMN05216464_104314 [Mucilaginibacter pineti]|uniref:Uncharacterized protein n=1 Tax=Mucilaginibacter pineti TaxID=1391627 RepID=A0A1G7AYY8_9SPHI|nr:hypothetical protein SAMN05216464_104314 [Mucilaginibacter pineti]
MVFSNKPGMAVKVLKTNFTTKLLVVDLFSKIQQL